MYTCVLTSTFVRYCRNSMYVQKKVQNNNADQKSDVIGFLSILIFCPIKILTGKKDIDVRKLKLVNLEPKFI